MIHQNLLDYWIVFKSVVEKLQGVLYDVVDYNIRDKDSNYKKRNIGYKI